MEILGRLTWEPVWWEFGLDSGLRNMKRRLIWESVGWDSQLTNSCSPLVAVAACLNPLLCWSDGAAAETRINSPNSRPFHRHQNFKCPLTAFHRLRLSLCGAQMFEFWPKSPNFGHRPRFLSPLTSFYGFLIWNLNFLMILLWGKIYRALGTLRYFQELVNRTAKIYETSKMCYCIRRRPPSENRRLGKSKPNKDSCWKLGSTDCCANNT